MDRILLAFESEAKETNIFRLQDNCDTDVYQSAWRHPVVNSVSTFLSCKDSTMIEF
jgi:hypothetical protein